MDTIEYMGHDVGVGSSSRRQPMTPLDVMGRDVGCEVSSCRQLMVLFSIMRQVRDQLLWRRYTMVTAYCRQLVYPLEFTGQ